MGPAGLIPQIPDASRVYWAEIPDGLDRSSAREFLACVASRVAKARGVPVPRSLGPVTETRDIAGVLDTLDQQELGPDLLGATWEHLMATADRRTRGAHFTPITVADRVVELSFGQLRSAPDSNTFRVWDPAAGGGAFLLAAARWLAHSTERSRADIVASMHATDIDSIALEVCTASLEIWSGGTATPVVECADALVHLSPSWPSDFDAVVGNPPFLGQLSSDTAREAIRRAQLVSAFPDVVHGYVDDSALFLHLALRRTKPGGVAALVLPESLLAARDAHAVRTSADSCADMTTLWVDEGQSFDAAVDVVAPVFVKTLRSGGPENRRVEVILGGADSGVAVTIPEDGRWAPLLAAARGVPAVEVETSGAACVGDLALVTAGFRQHFYGLADAVSESSGVPNEARLVTSGAIDPLRPLWGQKTVRFGGAAWSSPVVDLTGISEPSVREWFGARMVPKVLVASQTRVIEAVVDVGGTALPSVPVLSVEPGDAADLWRLAAVLTCPVISAWLATRSAGTGLGHTAFRVRARELASAPLPSGRASWDQGARAAEAAQRAAEHRDASTYASELRALANAMNSAYEVADDGVIDWWLSRLRLPEAF